MTTLVATGAPARSAHGDAIRRKQHLAAYAFVLPFFVVFATMLVAPLVYSGYLSFFADRLVGGVSFVAFENYLRAFQDPDFLAGLGRTALILVIQVPIMLGLALFFALALDSGRARGSKALRLLIFLPYAVPGVVAVLMWGYLYGQRVRTHRRRSPARSGCPHRTCCPNRTSCSRS